MFSHFRIRAKSRHAGRFSLAESAAGLTDLNGKKIKAKALQAVGAAHLDCAYASSQVRHLLSNAHIWNWDVFHAALAMENCVARENISLMMENKHRQNWASHTSFPRFAWVSVVMKLSVFVKTQTHFDKRRTTAIVHWRVYGHSTFSETVKML